VHSFKVYFSGSNLGYFSFPVTLQTYGAYFIPAMCKTDNLEGQLRQALPEGVKGVFTD